MNGEVGIYDTTNVVKVNPENSNDMYSLIATSTLEGQEGEEAEGESQQIQLAVNGYNITQIAENHNDPTNPNLPYFQSYQQLSPYGNEISHNAYDVNDLHYHSSLSSDSDGFVLTHSVYDESDPNNPIEILDKTYNLEEEFDKIEDAVIKNSDADQRIDNKLIFENATYNNRTDIGADGVNVLDTGAGSYASAKLDKSGLKTTKAASSNQYTKLDGDKLTIKYNQYTTEYGQGAIKYQNETLTLPSSSGTLALTSDIPSPSTYVTISGAQTITGQKTFENNITVNDESTTDKTVIGSGFINIEAENDATGYSGNSKTLIQPIDTNTVIWTKTTPTGESEVSHRAVVPNKDGVLAMTDDLHTIQYSWIQNTPTLATVATTGDYDDLIDKPQLATVATSGSYNDLLNKPTNLVTTDTTQTITAAKTLDGGNGTGEHVPLELKFNNNEVSAIQIYDYEDETYTNIDVGAGGAQSRTITLPNQSGTLALASQLPSNYVTVDTAQTITGLKTFTTSSTGKTGFNDTSLGKMYIKGPQISLDHGTNAASSLDVVLDNSTAIKQKFNVQGAGSVDLLSVDSTGSGSVKVDEAASFL